MQCDNHSNFQNLIDQSHILTYISSKQKSSIQKGIWASPIAPDRQHFCIFFKKYSYPIGFILLKLTHLIIALCLWGSFATESFAQRATEYEVKAAFLYNFARFVTWPDSTFKEAHTPLVIGVYGKDPFGSTLEQTIRDKTAQNQPIVIQHYQDIEDTLTCHILFIGPTEPKELSSLFKHLQTKSILTVGEQNDFCQNGGMVNFILVNRRVRFEINPQAIERSTLSISSRLLKLAQIVQDK